MIEKSGEKRGKKEKLKLERWQIWLIVAVLVATALLVYAPHFSYPYPFHIDEWHHIELAERLVYDQNYNISTALQYGNLEIGYHFFLAGLFSFERALGIDPVLAYKLLPAIFAIISSLILFFMMFKLTKNYWIAVFSMIFFASLKTNVNFLGLWFAVPLTFCIPLVFLFFWLFIIGWTENPKMLTWSSLLFLIILFTHPPSATFMLPVLLVYALINRKKLETGKKRWPHLLLFLLLLFAFPIVFLKFIAKESFFVSIKFILQKLIFKFGFTPTEPYLMPVAKIALFRKVILIHPYFLPWLFGFIPFALAIMGILISFKDKKLRIFSIWFIVTASLLFLFINFKFTILAPYQRIVYYSLLSLAPLASLGTVWAINLINKKTKKRNFWIMLLLLLVLFSAFFNYSNPPDNFDLYRIINSHDYDSLKFLGNQTNNSLVLAPLSLADAVYPISKNNVLAKNFFRGTNDQRSDIQSFFSANSSCFQKGDIIKKYNFSFVISKTYINCSQSLQVLYQNEDYIYKVLN